MPDDNYEFTMITAAGCTKCPKAEEELKDKINKGKIRVLDIMKSDEALDLAIKHKIRGTPTIILKDKILQTEEACLLSSDFKKVLCKDKEVEL